MTSSKRLLHPHSFYPDNPLVVIDFQINYKRAYALENSLEYKKKNYLYGTQVAFMLWAALIDMTHARAYNICTTVRTL